MSLINLWALCIFKRDGGWCQKCLSEGKWTRAVDAHHIIHKDKGLLLYLLDNGVALCRPCHDLDAQGRLKGWCVEHIGEEKYYKLKRMAHSLIGKPFDKEAKRKELMDFLKMEV